MKTVNKIIQVFNNISITTSKNQPIIIRIVGLLKKIFDLFYHSKFVFKCREGAAKRIDRRLAPIIALQQCMSAQQNAFSNKQNEFSIKQNEFSINLAQFHKSLDDRMVFSIQVSQLSAWNIKIQGERQKSIANINCLGSMLPDFSRAMKFIFTDESHYDHSYDSLILLELINTYIYDGGIWQLRQEINDFFKKSNLPQIDKRRKALPTDKPLKILIISGLFPAIEHGGGLRLHDIIQGLSASHEIDLYSVYDQEKDLHSLELLKDKLKDTRLIESEQIVDLEATKTDITNWLQNIGKNENYYDIIQLEYPHTIYLTNFMKHYGSAVGFTFMECLTKSNVIKIQELITTNNLIEMKHFAADLWKYTVAEKFAIENADFLIAVTPEDTDFLQRLHPRKPQIIPTCISQSEIIDKLESNCIAAEKGCVSFLGAFTHYPNIDSMQWYLTSIHPLIKKEIPDYKLIIIGAGDTSLLKALVQGDDQVEFTGRVDDVIPYIQRSSVCILPLITGAGIRGKLNQYSITKRPSVSTTIGNMGLNYEHEESVMIADNAHDFAAAVSLLLSDDGKNQAMSEHAKAHAKTNFTWEKHLQHLVDIYRNSIFQNHTTQ